MTSSTTFFRPLKNSGSKSNPITIRPSDIKQVLETYQNIKSISYIHPKSHFITELEKFYQSLSSNLSLTDNELYTLAIMLYPMCFGHFSSPKALAASAELIKKMEVLINYIAIDGDSELFKLIVARPELGMYKIIIELKCYDQIIRDQKISLYDEVFLEVELRESIRNNLNRAIKRHPDALEYIANNGTFTPAVLYSYHLWNKVNGGYQFIVPAFQLLDYINKKNNTLTNDCIDFVLNHANYADLLLKELKQLPKNDSIVNWLQTAFVNILYQLPPPPYEPPRLHR